jgi:Zn-dependent alcohol dehydrogenase
MKAAILVKQNKPLVVTQLDIPKELKYGQVLVKVFYSTICGAQINEFLGTKGPDKFLPHLLGHEGSGIVDECGPGVTTVKNGDKVVLHWRKGNGIQSETPKYGSKGKEINAGWVTTFNEYAVVSENRVTAIPEDSDMKTAPLYGCAITTAFGILQNEAHVKSGESMLIFGVGGVGSALILASKLISAYPIVAIDIHDSKLKKAMNFGATHIINSEKDDVSAKIKNMFPNGVDVVVETTGINSVKELSFELTAPQGKTVFVGVTKAGEKVSIDSTPLHFGKSLVTSYGGSSNPSNDIPRLINLQHIGRLNLDGMITQEYPLEKINDAFKYVMNSNGLRCLIKM